MSYLDKSRPNTNSHQNQVIGPSNSGNLHEDFRSLSVKVLSRSRCRKSSHRQDRGSMLRDEDVARAYPQFPQKPGKPIA